MLDADERLFPVTKSYLSHEMIRGFKNTGIKKIRIHDIRHPYVKPKTKNIILKSRNPSYQHRFDSLKSLLFTHYLYK